MIDISTDFFNALKETTLNKAIYTNDIPKEMMLSQIDQEGWFEWRLIKGTLTAVDYKEVENEFNVRFPKSFIKWHKKYFFLGADTSILRLPSSNPNLPLKEIRQNLDWFIASKLIPQKIYPFGSEGNDSGPLVFDGRIEVENNEFPIRYYDQKFGGKMDGLSEIIFSSFEKLLECMAFYMSELKRRRNFEIIPSFFEIDPKGAGLTGIDYWLSWIKMQRENYNLFED